MHPRLDGTIWGDDPADAAPLLFSYRLLSSLQRKSLLISSNRTPMVTVALFLILQLFLRPCPSPCDDQCQSIKNKMVSRYNAICAVEWEVCELRRKSIDAATGAYRILWCAGSVDAMPSTQASRTSSAPCLPNYCIDLSAKRDLLGHRHNTSIHFDTNWPKWNGFSN